jgi:hypothetical protein
MQRKNAVDWTKYLQPGEQLRDVPAATLRKRRHDSLGGTSTSKTEKKALLKREAKQAEYAKEGKLLDEALFAEMKQLEEHAKATYEGIPKSCGFGSAGVQWGSKFIPTSDLEYVFHLIQSGGELLRAINWQKLPSDDLGERRDSILEEDYALPYPDQKFYPFYAGAMVVDLVAVGHDVRLTKQLADFLVRIIEAYKVWGQDIQHPEDIQFRKEILTDLEALKSGRDLFHPRPLPAMGKPPAPFVLQAQEPPKKMYQTAEDVPIPDPAPTLTQLAIANYVKSGGNWLEAAATSGDIAEEI